MAQQKPTLGSLIVPGHPLARGLIGCYLLNEGGGTLAFDLSGNGHSGTLINGPTWHPLGVNFVAASNQNISLGATWLNALPEVSVVARARWDALGAEQAVLACWDGEGNLILLESNSRSLLVAVNSTSGVGWGSTTSPLSNGVDYTVALTYKSGELLGYLQGVQACSDATPPVGVLQSRAQNILIAENSISDKTFDGKISWVYIYNRALTAAEVALLHQHPYCFIRQPENRLIVPFIGALVSGAAPINLSATAVETEVEVVSASISLGALSIACTAVETEVEVVDPSISLGALSIAIASPVEVEVEVVSCGISVGAISIAIAAPVETEVELGTATLSLASIGTTTFLSSYRPLQKPPVGALVTASHPLAHGLVAAYVMNEFGSRVIGNLMIGGKTVALAAANTWKGGRYGPALGFTAATDVSVGDVNRLPVGSTPRTILTIARNTQSDTTFRTAYGYGTNAAGAAYRHGARWGNFVVGVQDGYRRFSLDISDGAWRVLVSVLPNGVTNVDGVLGYSDGVPLTESANITRAINTGTSGQYLGAAEDGGQNWEDDLAAIYVWERALTAAEVAEISARPFAFFGHGPLVIHCGIGAINLDATAVETEVELTTPTVALGPVSIAIASPVEVEPELVTPSFSMGAVSIAIAAAVETEVELGTATVGLILELGATAIETEVELGTCGITLGTSSISCTAVETEVELTTPTIVAGAISIAIAAAVETEVELASAEVQVGLALLYCVYLRASTVGPTIRTSTVLPTLSAYFEEVV